MTSYFFDDESIDEIAKSTQNVAEINKCRHQFLTAMLSEGIITEEQFHVMSCYFIQLVNKTYLGAGAWNIFAKFGNIKPDSNGTYYEVVKMSGLPDDVRELIAILKEQTSEGDQSKKKLKGKSGDKVVDIKKFLPKKDNTDEEEDV